MSPKTVVKRRPSSRSSRGVWNDDGLDAPGGRPESSNSNEDYQNRDLSMSDPDMPTAMESEEFVDGQIYVAGQERPPGKPAPVSGFEKFKIGLKAMWATRQTMDESALADPNVKASTALRELVVYVTFLAFLLIITFGHSSTNAFYMTRAMQNLFLTTPFPDTGNTFTGITTIQDFWRFSETVLMDGLYADWETYYNNRSVPENELGYLFNDNKLLGVPRLRQLKVNNQSCSIHSDFQDEVKQCFDAYAQAIEETGPFGKLNGTAWVYSSEKALNGSGHSGILATYSGGGYYIDLMNNSADSAAIIDDLKQNLWIDRGTRAIFLDFSLYNANINLFCIIRLVFEFPPTGGIIPSYVFRTVKLLKYVTPFDYFVAVCEGIYAVFIIYYIIEELLELKKHKSKYFSDIWNWLDIMIIGLSLICMGFSAYSFFKVNKLLTGLLSEPNKFGDFEFLSYWSVNYNYAAAFIAFLSWIKIFKYASFNKTMSQLTMTLGKAKKDIFGFLVMFMIIFFAFAQLGYLLFGTQVQDLSSVAKSMFTLFRIILGDFNFQELESAHRVLGPLYFILFVFVVFFVLLNMFLAIINDTYGEVKAELATAKNEIEMGDFFKQQYNKMMSKMNIKRDKIHGMQRAVKSADKDNDKKIDFEEFKADLRGRGYTEDEIKTAFAKYDKNNDKVLNEDEQKQMLEDLEVQRATLAREFNELTEQHNQQKSATSNPYSSGEDSDDEGTSRTTSSRKNGSQAVNGVAYEEFMVLSRRVDRMEHSIGSIVSKIDAVLVKLEAMEKAKLKRRETMGKLLDSINESDINSDEMKRDQMERLVREELERWDSESNVDGAGTGGSNSSMQRVSPSAALSSRGRSNNSD